MNILLCVKQVPDDPVKNVLIRKGVPSILNPFDSYALEAAARIKDTDPATKIVALSMGPPQAEAVLRECLAIAADSAYLVSGRAFGGSDTLATSYILAEAIKLVSEKEGPFDAVFCGKQAIDGDTAQVGPEIAEHLGIPQVTYGLEAEAAGDVLNVRRETEAGYAVVSVKTPCLVTFTKPSFGSPLPDHPEEAGGGQGGHHGPVRKRTHIIDRTQIRPAGSPTKVKKTYVPSRRKECKYASRRRCSANSATKAR